MNEVVVRLDKFQLCGDCIQCKDNKDFYIEHPHPPFVICSWPEDCCYCRKLGLGNCLFNHDMCYDTIDRAEWECIHDARDECCYCSAYINPGYQDEYIKKFPKYSYNRMVKDNE